MGENAPKFDNKEIIMEPIKVDKPRDNNRGLRMNRPAKGFVCEFEEEEGEEIEIRCGLPGLPSDEEIAAMKEESARIREEEAKKKTFWYKVKSFFGFGG